MILGESGGDGGDGLASIFGSRLEPEVRAVRSARGNQCDHVGAVVFSGVQQNGHGDVGATIEVEREKFGAWSYHDSPLSVVSAECASECEVSRQA